MRQKILCMCISGLLLLMTACAHTTLTAPCPNYGAHCYKTPVNSWDYGN